MRRYTVTVNAIAVTTAKDLIRISAPSTMVLCVIRAWVGQSGNVTSENGRVLLQRASDSQTGTTETPQPLEVGDPAATFTSQSITTDHTLTGDPHLDRSFNWVVGDEWVPAPEERIWVPPSGRLVFRLATTPAASKTVSAGMTVIEIG
jgi:hypothetical protein